MRTAVSFSFMKGLCVPWHEYTDLARSNSMMQLSYAISTVVCCFGAVAAVSQSSKTTKFGGNLYSRTNGPSESHAIHEERRAISKYILSSKVPRILTQFVGARWAKGNRVPGSRRLPVRIGLTQNNLHRAEEFLLDVSHPKSHNYGKLWTSDEVIAAFQPSDDAVTAVREWLASHGIVEVTHSENKGWLAFDAPATEVEGLLQTEYYEYEDQFTGGLVHACELYHVSAQIQEHIDYITPGTKLMAPVRSDIDLRLKREGRQNRRRDRIKQPVKQLFSEELLRILSGNTSDISTCDTAITPACVAALYNIPPGNLSVPNNSLGVFEAELRMYFLKFFPICVSNM